MTVLLGAGGAVVVLVVLVSVRWALRAVRERRGGRFVVSSERWDAALRALACASPEYAYYPPVANPRLLTDEELCQAWCASCQVARTVTSPRRLKVVAQERRSYLDELQRRHPLAVEAWLAGPATADGDPMPYLRRGFGDLHQEDR
jgi:hypothetical protein